MERPAQLARLLVAALAFSVAAALIDFTNESDFAGTTYYVGDTLHVRFATDQTKVTQVTIYISVDSGKRWLRISSDSFFSTSAMWGDFEWPVPSTMEVYDFDTYEMVDMPTISDSCKIMIEKYDSSLPDEKVVSSGVFAIAREPVPDAPPVRKSDDDGGCGKGGGLAILPPLWFRLARRFRRKDRSVR